MKNGHRLFIIYTVTTMYIIVKYFLVIPGWSVSTKNKFGLHRIPLGARNRLFWGRIPRWIYLRRRVLEFTLIDFGISNDIHKHISICIYVRINIFICIDIYMYTYVHIFIFIYTNICIHHGE